MGTQVGKAAWALAPMLLFGAAAIAQNAQIEVLAISGKTGKPLARQRLLVFGGASQNDARAEKNLFDLTTDKDGVARLTIDPLNVMWIQVWVESQALCDTNHKVFSVGEIVSTGANAPNTCSSAVRELVPHQLVVFARPKSLREKMQQ
jgi:hypothetical protein